MPNQGICCISATLRKGGQMKTFVVVLFGFLASKSFGEGVSEADLIGEPAYTYNLLTSRECPSFKWVIKKGEKYKPSRNLDLPKKVDFSSEFNSLKDQKRLGSCTAQAISLSLEYILRSRCGINETLSPLYVYYNERKLTGSVDRDSGASLSDAIMAVKKYGACREITWPYISIGIQYKVKPPKEAYLEGKKLFSFKQLIHINLPHDLSVIKSVLAQNIPVLCGINVFLSAETTKAHKSGIIPLPSFYEKPLGSHAIVLVGYNDKKQLFKFANSWGEKWGEKGFGYIPYKYIMNNNPSNQEIHTILNELWCTHLKK